MLNHNWATIWSWYHESSITKNSINNLVADGISASWNVNSRQFRLPRECLSVRFIIIWCRFGDSSQCRRRKPVLCTFNISVISNPMTTRKSTPFSVWKFIVHFDENVSCLLQIQRALDERVRAQIVINVVTNSVGKINKIYHPLPLSCYSYSPLRYHWLATIRMQSNIECPFSIWFQVLTSSIWPVSMKSYGVYQLPFDGSHSELNVKLFWQ